MPFQLCTESRFQHKCSKLSLQLMPLWMLLTHINAFGALLSCFFSIFRAKIWIMYEADNALRRNVALLCCSFQSFLKIFLIHKVFAVKLLDEFWHLTYNSRPCALSIAIQKVNNLSGSHTFGKHTVRHLRVFQPQSSVPRSCVIQQVRWTGAGGSSSFGNLHQEGLARQMYGHKLRWQYSAACVQKPENPNS